MFTALPSLSLLGFEKLDFSLYPDREYQLAWLRNYLEFSFEESGQSASSVTDVDVERLYVQVNKFALVSWISLACVHTFGISLNYLTLSWKTCFFFSHLSKLN